MPAMPMTAAAARAAIAEHGSQRRAARALRISRWQLARALAAEGSPAPPPGPTVETVGIEYVPRPPGPRRAMPTTEPRAAEAGSGPRELAARMARRAWRRCAPDAAEAADVIGPDTIPRWAVGGVLVGASLVLTVGPERLLGGARAVWLALRGRAMRRRPAATRRPEPAPPPPAAEGDPGVDAFGGGA